MFLFLFQRLTLYSVLEVLRVYYLFLFLLSLLLSLPIYTALPVKYYYYYGWYYSLLEIN